MAYAQGSITSFFFNASSRTLGYMSWICNLSWLLWVIFRCDAHFSKRHQRITKVLRWSTFCVDFGGGARKTEPPTRVMPLTYPASVFAVTNDGQQVAEIVRKKTEDGQREGGGKKKKKLGPDSDTLQGEALSTEIKVSRCLCGCNR